VPCIFCGGASVTREHVYGRAWIERLLPNASGFTNTVSKGEGQALEAGSWPSRGAGVVVRCACAHCNNGWMNDLDRRAEPMLTEMARADRRVRIEAGALSVFATWATKVAFVMSAMHSPVPVYVDDRERLRRTQAPPPGVVVWVGSMESYDAEIRTTPITLRTGPDKGALEQAFLATFRLLHLVVQVLAPIERVCPEHDEWGSAHTAVAWPRVEPLEVPLPEARRLRSEHVFDRLVRSFRGAESAQR
jgi:hypothetical protein